MSRQIHIELVSAKNNQLTARAIVNRGNTFYLHSSVDPEGEAKAWLQRIELTENTLFLVLGCGLAYHVRALLDKLPDNSYIVVVASQQEFDCMQTIKERNPLYWREDNRTRFLLLGNTYGMSVALANFMLDKMVKIVSVCKHLPSMQIAAEEYVRVEQELVPKIELAMGLNFNVTLTSGYHFLKNYWLNFSSLATHHGISVLNNTFRDIPVIVVAAGPSLDKNIHLLKECTERAVIIAGGTAIGPLAKHGIKPDFFIVSDVLPENYEVLKEYLDTGAALVSFVSASYNIIEKYPTSIYFYKSGYDYFAGSLSLFPDIIDVQQNVSVTTGAVDFAVKCGAKKVILIGQDLAYAPDKEYAEGTQGAGYGMLKKILIPGCDGKMVESNATFKAAIEYYNQYVLQYQNVQFINATEGGALIVNMQQQTLSAVIDTMLPKKKVDKSFIHRRSNRKKIPNQVIGYVIQLKREIEELYYHVQNFINKEKLSEEDDLGRFANNQELLEEKLQILRTFYTDITMKRGYRYIEMFMRPRVSFVHFQTQDGMVAENEYISYCTLIFDVHNILKEFLEWTKKSIKELQEKCGGKSKCKR